MHAPACLSSGKALRIETHVHARSVAEVGIAGSTFERVSAKAGLSRGLLHHFFGSKEKLLVEVIRRGGSPTLPKRWE